MYKLIGAALFCFIVIVIGNVVIVAQTMQGEWRADARTEKDESVQLSFARSMSGRRNETGQSFKFSDLSGLTREQALAGGPVRFSLRREAGTIDMDGTFANGKGSGKFVFNADPGFLSAMKQRGFDFEKPTERTGKFKVDSADESDRIEHKLLLATVLNVTTTLADDLLSADFGKLEADDLFKAAIFKVDSAFMREMKQSGFKNLSFDDLVKARIFKIDGAYLRELAAAGFDNEPFENVVKMRIFKITPEFISGVRSEGFAELDIEGLVKLKIFNIDADFIRRARAEGVPMEVEKLVQKRIGVWGR